jgi:hypothetical protein
MDQPLWQNWLNITMIGLIARRAAVGLGLYWDKLEPVLRDVYIGLLAMCALAGIAVWLSSRWVIAALSLLACAFAVSTIAEFSIGTGVATQPAWLIAQLVFVLVGTGGLIMLARRAAPRRQTHKQSPPHLRLYKS